MKNQRTLCLAGAFILAGILQVSADTMLVNRGLPTINLNDAAGANRANVAWAFTEYTSPDYWVVGDTFQNTGSQTWYIDKIRLWTVGETDTAILRGGLDGSAIGIASSAVSISDATYADSSLYQGNSGSFIAMHQVDFAVNIALAPGQVYDFFLDGSGSGDGTYVPFAHASNAALSGSPQDQSDNLMLGAEVVNGVVDPTSVGTWNSDQPGVWDKDSDVNVQVFGQVPDAGASFALLGFALASLASFRRWVK